MRCLIALTTILRLKELDVVLNDADISGRYSLSVNLIGIARLANRVAVRIPSLVVRESFLSWITSDSKEWNIRGM
jgi:hypothetical protein